MRTTTTLPLADVAARMFRWLSSAFTDTAAFSTTDLLHAHLSFALCCDLAPDLSAEIVPQLHPVRQALSEKHSDDLWQCDSGAILLCCLVQHHLEGGMLPEFEAYAEEAAVALEQVSQEPLPTQLYTAYFLAHRLGLLPAPTPPAPPWPDDLFALLTGDEEQVRVVARHIAVRTNYGMQRVDPPNGLMKVLEVTALHALKTYDFDLGGAVLRALAYLGERKSLAMQTARAFIVTHQDVDGSIGFLAPEIAALNLDQDASASIKVQLPYALASLWALAETGTHPYRLFHHLPRM